MSDQKEFDSVETRTYTHIRNLKYGCNPHQKPAAIFSTSDSKGTAFEILNGNPGYINILDAMNAWQLVKELKEALDLPAASSFKHVSPAGAAVGVELSALEREVYGVGDKTLTPAATAYLRAREADPKSSFGDFAALSDKVDEATALIIKIEVSDGIIAPDYDEKALEILKKKKGGAYIILKANLDYVPPPVEYREVYGVCFAQKRNDVKITKECMSKVVTKIDKLSDEAIRDMVIATITLKYTQSNSVGYAMNGQMIGVGAGQQSRVDCVKLAGSKVETWYLRQHPKVRNLKFKPKTLKVAKLNARVQFIEGDFTKHSRGAWESLLEEVPADLTSEEKKEFLSTLKGVSLSSDAFFPFPDNIDHASMRGVSYIAQPGGSKLDKQVIETCDEYGMAMSFTDTRLFHH